MPPKALWKQNGPPARVAPEGVVTGPHAVNPLLSSRPMNMYSTFALQFCAKAHSSPPPIVHVVTVSFPEVEMSQFPHPAAVFWHASTTEARGGTKAAPPFTYSRVLLKAYPNRPVAMPYQSPTLALPNTSSGVCAATMVLGSKASPLSRM